MILFRAAATCVTLMAVPDEIPENPDEVEGMNQAAEPCEYLISSVHVDANDQQERSGRSLRWWRAVVLLPSSVWASQWRGPRLASRYRSRETSAFRATPQKLSVVRSTTRCPCGSTSGGSGTGRTGR